jgi:hypothetical protein
MTTCQARLDRRLVNGPAGWPEYEYGGVCTQTVGVSPIPPELVLAPGEWAACSRPGHREDVLAQVKAAELAERVRHEVAEDDGRAAWLDDEREPVEPVEAWR